MSNRSPRDSGSEWKRSAITLALIVVPVTSVVGVVALSRPMLPVQRVLGAVGLLLVAAAAVAAGVLAGGLSGRRG